MQIINVLVYLLNRNNKLAHTFCKWEHVKSSVNVPSAYTVSRCNFNSHLRLCSIIPMNYIQLLSQCLTVYPLYSSSGVDDNDDDTGHNWWLC